MCVCVVHRQWRRGMKSNLKTETKKKLYGEIVQWAVSGKQRERQTKKVLPVSIVVITCMSTSIVHVSAFVAFSVWVYSGEFHSLRIVIDWLGWPGGLQSLYRHCSKWHTIKLSTMNGLLLHLSAACNAEHVRPFSTHRNIYVAMLTRRIYYWYLGSVHCPLATTRRAKKIFIDSAKREKLKSKKGRSERAAATADNIRCVIVMRHVTRSLNYDSEFPCSMCADIFLLSYANFRPHQRFVSMPVLQHPYSVQWIFQLEVKRTVVRSKRMSTFWCKRDIIHSIRRMYQSEILFFWPVASGQWPVAISGYLELADCATKHQT